MSIQLPDVREQAMQLPPAERVRLAQQLWDSVADEPQLSDSELSATLEMARKRDHDLNAGAPSVSHAEVVKAAREALQCTSPTTPTRPAR